MTTSPEQQAAGRREAAALAVDEYVMDGIQRGNEDIEGSSVSAAHPQTTDQTHKGEPHAR